MFLLCLEEEEGEKEDVPFTPLHSDDSFTTYKTATNYCYMKRPYTASSLLEEEEEEKRKNGSHNHSLLATRFILYLDSLSSSSSP